MQSQATMSPAILAPRRRIMPFIYQYGVYFIFALMVVSFSFTNDNFLTIPNFMNILQQAVPLGLAAIGVTFVLVTGGVDISIGQNMYLSAVMVGLSLEIMAPMGLVGTPISFVIVVLVAITTGALIGALNGIMVAKFKIVPFITTLATMGIARGVGLLVSNSKVYYVESLSTLTNNQFFGIPYVVIVLAGLVLLFNYILRSTPFGRHLMAIGNDSNAAHKIGIRVQRNVFFAYVICGIMAALGGMVMAGQVANVAVYFADGAEFLAISAAVLGGISLFGGKGSVFPGALIGIILVTTIVNGMTMMGASPYAYKIIRGGIIFLAVMVDSVRYKGELR
jgi:ribose/xylose/arabinose/galactoside ABC-type transport system permease subunit